MAEQVRLCSNLDFRKNSCRKDVLSYRKISQLVIRKKWKEGTKTQQQKLSEAFIHLSLQVYHHYLPSQMFRYSFQ